MQNKQQNSTSIQNKNSQKTRNIRKPQFKGSSKKIYSSNFMVKHCSPLSTENKTKIIAPQFSSVAQSVWLCDPMDCSTPGFLVHHQLPGACSDSCPSSQWCHPAISSSVVPLSSCPHPSIYIYPHLLAPPSQLIPSHSSRSSQSTSLSKLFVLYSRFQLASYFNNGNLYMSFLISKFVTPILSPIPSCSFSMSASLFLLCK